MINNFQPISDGLRFKGATFTVGPSSWRSSSSSSSRSSNNSPSSFHYGYTPIMYPFPYPYNSRMSSVDPIKMQKEKAKDELFIQNHPEIMKRINPGRRILTWGSIATLLTALLSRGIEISRKTGDWIINFDPLLLIVSLGVGVIAGIITAGSNKDKVRRERYKYEIQEKE